MKNYKSLHSNHFVNKIMGGAFRIHQTELLPDSKKLKDSEIKNDSYENKMKEELDLDEYDDREFDRSIDDPTDKTKPFDNFHTKVSRPDLKEQYEKRKDIFHTKDTFYMKNEKNIINEDKK
jgi:hypothetical protein